jgi:hypothetical protein
MRRIAKGLATYVPGFYATYGKLWKATGGSNSARYCYSVWLRHLVMMRDGGRSPRSAVVAELGPGDSLGSGLAALLTGAERYVGLDVIRYADTAKNLEVLDGLLELLRARADIPGPDEFPKVLPLLDDYRFPADLLPDDLLARTLTPERIERIRRSLREPEGTDSLVGYAAPWYAAEAVRPGTVDLVFSQAVLQSVEDLAPTYRALCAWLKPGGLMSHQLSLECLGTADRWNGHWCHSDLTWRLIKGRRPFLINREPWSTHARLLREAGFDIVLVKKVTMPSDLRRQDLAPRFRDMPDEDLTTSSAYVLATRAR